MTISGNLISMSGERHIAIYLREGCPWVAVFAGERGALHRASEWFASHRRGGLTREALERCVAIDEQWAGRIEQLHRTGAQPQAARAQGGLRALLAGLGRLMPA